MEKINLNEKFGRFDAHWQPKIVAELNGQYVKLAKLQGEFVWHHHAKEDELFLVVQGRLTIVSRRQGGRGAGRDDRGARGRGAQASGRSRRLG